MYETEFVGELFILDEFVRVCYEFVRVSGVILSISRILNDVAILYDFNDMIFNVTVLGLVLAQRLIQVAAWTTS